MRDKNLELRGRACPEPVTETLELLRAEPGPSALTVLVDNDGAAENVRRAAVRSGAEVAVRQDGPDVWQVVIERAGGAHAPTDEQTLAPVRPATERRRAAVLICSKRFGEGSDELGRNLMQAFVKTIKEVVPLPGWVLMVNSGIKLACEGSRVIDELRNLVDLGVEVRACGTCLDYFELKDKLRVGVVTNMYEIVTVINQADHVMRP